MNHEPHIDPALPQDFPAARELLALCRLPLQGVEDHWNRFLVARHDGNLVGCVGIEIYGTACVLRSLAVAPPFRGSGLGRRLMAAIIGSARDSGLTDAYGLTATAERMMTRLGFRAIPRETVPVEVRASREFHIPRCSSATVIHLRL